MTEKATTGRSQRRRVATMKKQGQATIRIVYWLRYEMLFTLHEISRHLMGGVSIDTLRKMCDLVESNGTYTGSAMLLRSLENLERKVRSGSVVQTDVPQPHEEMRPVPQPLLKGLVASIRAVQVQTKCPSSYIQDKLQIGAGPFVLLMNEGKATYQVFWRVKKFFGRLLEYVTSPEYVPFDRTPPKYEWAETLASAGIEPTLLDEGSKRTISCILPDTAKGTTEAYINTGCDEEKKLQHEQGLIRLVKEATDEKDKEDAKERPGEELCEDATLGRVITAVNVREFLSFKCFSCGDTLPPPKNPNRKTYQCCPYCTSEDVRCEVVVRVWVRTSDIVTEGA